jgi:hypothetical protein
MAIPIQNNNAAPGIEGYERAAKGREASSAASAVATSRAELNSAIVETSMKAAFSAGNEPLGLLLKAAVAGINDALRPALGENAIERAAVDQDNSADATAARIVSLSTGFYDAYRTQNKLEDSPESRAKFIEVIRGGFEQGFKEAQKVLEGLQVLKGDVAAGIDQTYKLVVQGFEDFANAYQSQPGGPAPAQAPD